MRPGPVFGGRYARGSWPAVSPGGLSALAGAGVAATIGAVVVAVLAAPPEREVVAGLLHGVVVAVPVALGCAELARRPGDRFGLLLVVTGLLWSTTALAESSNAVLYSAGRVLAWCSDLMVLVLLLTFPSGRVRTASEQRLLKALLALLVVGYLPTALLFDQYPLPTPYTSCEQGCPGNAFDIVSWGFVDDIVRPLREVATVLLYGAVLAVLVRRSQTSGRLLTLALGPVLLMAAFRTVALAVYLSAREAGVTGAAIDALGWVYLATLPLVAISFAAGIALRRFQVAGVLRRLGGRLSAHPSPADLTTAITEALEDPSVRIVYRVPGEDVRWADATGWPVVAPAASDDVGMIDLRSQDRVLGALLYDVTAAPDAALLDATAVYAVVVLENLWLVEQLQSSLSELSASRERIVAVADASRHEIERDLHDGAQQRLVGLRLKLAVQTERLRRGEPAEEAVLNQLGDEVEEAIDHIRELALGIYPSVLAERGLPHALRSAALRSPVATSVRADGVGRYRRDVESTVYFACLEAMQNAAKHAEGATEVSVALSAEGGLSFEVRDDGRGFDQAAVPPGTGLLNVRDRVMALGGSVRIESAPQAGTLVAGVLPVREDEA
ncbi:MAG TPA: ATP-binding protein [Baekduia sp.]|uniref:sensor histidine kinase n=1 Tax=Baekduia sp. TaxID=2600305 RepID=UPI002BAD626D|nr:ATP-binding protein [Baekduia sp.]HMJ36686.1 ATP-binding protein [Baekduia sp.]